MNIGDKVICVRNEFANHEWEKVGIIAPYFKVGDVLEVLRTWGNKPNIIAFTERQGCYYPNCGFELYVEEKPTEPENYEHINTILDKLNIK